MHLRYKKGLFMRLKSLPYTFKRYGNYYIQIRLSDGRSYKKSLSTDSYREASALMVCIIPHLPFVKSLATPLPVFEVFLSNLITSERKAARNPLLAQQQQIIVPTLFLPRAKTFCPNLAFDGVVAALSKARFGAIQHGGDEKVCRMGA